MSWGVLFVLAHCLGWDEQSSTETTEPVGNMPCRGRVIRKVSFVLKYYPAIIAPKRGGHISFHGETWAPSARVAGGDFFHRKTRAMPEVKNNIPGRTQRGRLFI